MTHPSSPKVTHHFTHIDVLIICNFDSPCNDKLTRGTLTDHDTRMGQFCDGPFASLTVCVPCAINIVELETPMTDFYRGVHENKDFINNVDGVCCIIRGSNDQINCIFIAQGTVTVTLG